MKVKGLGRGLDALLGDTRAPAPREEQSALREVPIDPIVGNNTAWRIVMEPAMQSVSQTEPGIFDVKSASDAKSLEGTPYSDW